MTELSKSPPLAIFKMTSAATFRSFSMRVPYRCMRPLSTTGTVRFRSLSRVGLVQLRSKSNNSRHKQTSEGLLNVLHLQPWQSTAAAGACPGPQRSQYHSSGLHSPAFLLNLSDAVIPGLHSPAFLLNLSDAVIPFRYTATSGVARRYERYPFYRPQTYASFVICNL
jgi:hypothetical protein